MLHTVLAPPNPDTCTETMEARVIERELRKLVVAVKEGLVSRRAFVRKMVGLGFTAPFANHLLAHSGVAQPPAVVDYKPTKAGGGGPLKMLFWQAPTLLNPHFAVGGKDQHGSVFSTSRLRHGTPTAFWCRCSPRRYRKSRTEGSRRTACR